MANQPSTTAVTAKDTHDVSQSPTSGANSTGFQSPKAINKAAIARDIFRATTADTPRKDVLQRFMTEAHLTKAGASTYYQNMKKDDNLTAHRAKAIGPTNKV